jgi:hypothetical protein
MSRLAILITALMLLASASVPTNLAAGQKKDKGQEVTAKEIEIFGKDLLGKRCHMNCKFEEVSDTWVKLLLRDESFVGIYVRDSKDTLFQYAFANKKKYGRDLLKMTKGDRLCLIGTVESVESTYVFMVEEIEK